MAVSTVAFAGGGSDGLASAVAAAGDVSSGAAAVADSACGVSSVFASVATGGFAADTTVTTGVPSCIIFMINTNNLLYIHTCKAPYDRSFRGAGGR